MDRTEFQQLAENHGLGHVAQNIFNTTKPCIQVSSSPADDDQLPVGSSKIGGNLDVPTDFEWPYWRNSFLSLLIQINLSNLQDLMPINDLPASGVLSFFYEHNDEAKWFDPADQEAYQVYYFENTDALVRTT